MKSPSLPPLTLLAPSKWIEGEGHGENLVSLNLEVQVRRLSNSVNNAISRDKRELSITVVVGISSPLSSFNWIYRAAVRLPNQKQSSARQYFFGSSRFFVH